MFYFSFFLSFVKAEMLPMIKAGEHIGLAYSDRKRKLMLGVKDMGVLNNEQAASQPLQNVARMISQCWYLGKQLP